jgi:nucleoside-diphosphate-sugar epimerase
MPAVIVDNSHARSLGWAPRYGFAEGVAEVWEEWKAADLSGVAG